jgi:small subunit ribosomal protein S1
VGQSVEAILGLSPITAFTDTFSRRLTLTIMASSSKAPQNSKISFSMDDFDKALAAHDYHFEQGQTVRGVVIEHISDGAFVDIGGKSSGFVPSQEAALHNELPLAENLPIGESFSFLIIRGQNDDGQVTLSRRQLFLQEAWQRVTELSEANKVVEIRITGSNKGGVTGDVEGLRGFIPRSHLIERNDLDSLLGQKLSANFLEIDRDRNKLVLSQRQLARSNALTQLVKGALTPGKIVKLQPYGVFVDLNGITGLLHITQISGARVNDLASVFTLGQEIQVVILDIDDLKNRISLSTKILEKYPGELLENSEEVFSTAGDRLEQIQDKLAKAESESG